MSEAANISEPMTERHGRLLAAFSERCAKLTAELCDRAMAAEDASEAADLARAFHAVGRSLRQAIALEQKLERAAALAQREDREAAETQRKTRTAERRADLQRTVRKVLFTEHEWDDYVDAGEGLERLLDEICPEPGFLDEDFKAQVQRLTEGARRWLSDPNRRRDDDDEDDDGEDEDDLRPAPRPDG